MLTFPQVTGLNGKLYSSSKKGTLDIESVFAAREIQKFAFFFAHVHAVVWCVAARREAQMGAQRLQGSELGDCMSEEDKRVKE